MQVSVLTRPSTCPLYAAVRPVIPAVRASCSISIESMTAERDEPALRALSEKQRDRAKADVWRWQCMPQ